MPLALLVALAAWLAKLALLFLLLAAAETQLAKMRLFDVPEYLGAAFILAFLGMLARYMLEGA